MRPFITLLSFVAFLLTGCVKESIVQDEADLTGTWAVTDIRSDAPYDWDGNGRSETNIYNTYSYCQRDIVLVFDNGGYGQSRQGCDAPWRSLSWNLESGNRLYIQLNGDDLVLDRLSVNSNTMRGEDRVTVDGRSFIISYTLSRR